MSRSVPVLAAFAAALSIAAPSRAAEDVAALRAAIEQMKSEYAARDRRAGTAPRAARGCARRRRRRAGRSPRRRRCPGPAAGGGAAAFNPAISVILGGTYAHLSQDPARYAIAGFMPNGGEIGPGPRDFSLGESELTLAASVDPYFHGNLTVSVAADNTVAVEEAYLRTSALPQGFTLKGGRFLSAAGYLNEVHAHAWDFVDQPLVYQAMFGPQLRQDGLQLKWLAPTLLFLEVGAEAGNGAAFPATARPGHGVDSLALITHLGGDVGDATSWRAGLSWLEAHAEDRAYEDLAPTGASVVDAFSGRSRTWILDATLKWAPHGDATRTQLKLQGEYLRRTETGTLVYDADGAGLAGDFHGAQAGWYLQGVYQFRPRWRIGARFDALDPGRPAIGLVRSGQLPASAFPALLGATPRRYTLMLDWSPSEFSRLRAQYALDEARLAGRDRELLLQYLISIGAHGAHKF
ncbi:MAG: hypothetical protein U1F30_14940 [Steroidobacteraceae bacterium]